MILFHDLLEETDFEGAVDKLAHGFREMHELPGVHQLGLVVPDAEAAAKDLEGRGLGPFFIASGSPVLWRERGEERSFTGKLGLAYYRGFELELLEPGVGSDFYRRSLDPEGGIVVQHLGFLADDVDKEAGKLEERGIQTWVRGCIKTGPMNTDFAYMDTVEETGLVIEFISMKFMGRKITPSSRLIHTIGRLQRWSGKRSFTL